jgi:hypothetical protein
MNRQKRPSYSGIQHFEGMIKIQLCWYFNRFYILKNVHLPKVQNLWIDQLSKDYIHFEANVNNQDCVDYKMKWSTYLAVMANHHLN